LVSSGIAYAADDKTCLPTIEREQGWISLFDGESLFGWEPGSDANWKVVDGAITVSEGKSGLLCTTTDWADYELSLEFRAPADTNSGVFLRSPLKPKDPTKDCYELNICSPTESPFPTGSFVGRKGIKPTVAADTWHQYRVTAHGGTFTVLLDGVEVLRYEDNAPLRRGRIGLQLNHGAVAFRNIKLRPMGLGELFNHKDLANWIAPGGQQGTFAAEDGVIRVTNGPGRLESKDTFGDFVSQWDVMTHGKALNSGLFFRCIPGEALLGYEAQIHNGYQDGDRTKPIDFGTGAIYRRVAARRVVSDDLEWTHMTLAVTGNRFAVWVNGYQVTAWTDERPPHDNPRQGFRSAAGTLALQAHDPTTDLSFRNLRAVELPANP
jgi:hypothetical protein